VARFRPLVPAVAGVGVEIWCYSLGKLRYSMTTSELVLRSFRIGYFSELILLSCGWVAFFFSFFFFAFFSLFFFGSLDHAKGSFISFLVFPFQKIVAWGGGSGGRFFFSPKDGVQDRSFVVLVRGYFPIDG